MRLLSNWISANLIIWIHQPMTMILHPIHLLLESAADTVPQQVIFQLQEERLSL